MKVGLLLAWLYEIYEVDSTVSKSYYMARIEAMGSEKCGYASGVGIMDLLDPVPTIRKRLY